MTQANSVPTCVFCAIVAGTASAEFVAEWSDTIAIRPHTPCTPGHMLVIPKQHVRDFTTDRVTTGVVVMRAAELAGDCRGDWNLITSAGTHATQTVFHLHVHLVPRRPGDDLWLPWSEHSTCIPVEQA